MGLNLTLGLMFGALALAAAFGWLGARKPDPSKGPRLVPWRMLMTLAAASALLLLVHVVNLLGLTTGR